MGIGLVAAAVLTASPADAATTYGPYAFINNSSHLCMDVAYGSTADGGRIQQWYCYGGTPEKWSMVKVKRIGVTDYFELVNQNSNKCLDVPGGNGTAGVLLQQWHCWGGDMQLWAVETQSATQSARVKNLMTGMCLDNKDWSNSPGTSLQQWPCNDLPPQQWHLA